MGKKKSEAKAVVSAQYVDLAVVPRRIWCPECGQILIDGYDARGIPTYLVCPNTQCKLSGLKLNVPTVTVTAIKE